MLEDKQDSNSIIANLQILAAKYGTLGQQFLYDTRAIPNLSELKTPSDNPKFIAFDSTSGVPID